MLKKFDKIIIIYHNFSLGYHLIYFMTFKNSMHNKVQYGIEYIMSLSLILIFVEPIITFTCYLLPFFV